MNFSAIMSVFSIARSVIESYILKKEIEDIKDSLKNRTDEEKTELLLEKKKNKEEQQNQAKMTTVSGVFGIAYTATAALTDIKEMGAAIKELFLHGGVRGLFGASAIPVIGQVFLGVAAGYSLMKIATAAFKKNPYPKNSEEHSIFEQKRRTNLVSNTVNFAVSTSLLLISIFAPPLAPIIGLAGFGVSSAFFFGSAYREKKMDNKLEEIEKQRFEQKAVFSDSEKNAHRAAQVINQRYSQTKQINIPEKDRGIELVPMSNNKNNQEKPDNSESRKLNLGR